MNMTDMPGTDLAEDVAELGVASIDTKGTALVGEEIGGHRALGISED